MSVLNPIYQNPKQANHTFLVQAHRRKRADAPGGRIYNETLDASYLLDVYYDDSGISIIYDTSYVRYVKYVIIREIGGWREMGGCTNILRGLVAEEKQSARCNK